MQIVFAKATVAPLRGGDDSAATGGAFRTPGRRTNAHIPHLREHARSVRSELGHRFLLCREVPAFRHDWFAHCIRLRNGGTEGVRENRVALPGDCASRSTGKRFAWSRLPNGAVFVTASGLRRAPGWLWWRMNIQISTACL